MPPPPPPRAAKPQGPLEALGDLAAELRPECLAGRTFAPEPAGPCPGGLTELLQPVRVCMEAASPSNDFLLALLDPLKSSGQEPGLQPSASLLLGPAPPSPAAGPPLMAGDLAPLGGPVGYLSPVAAAPFVQAPSLNPFVQTVPLSLARPPQSPFGPCLGRAYSSSPLALSMPNLFAQSPAAAAPPSRPPPRASGPSKIRTLPLPHAAARREAQARLAARPCDLPLAPHRARAAEPGLPPAKPKDPFEDLLSTPRLEGLATPGKVEQLRRQWETFE